MRCLWLTRFLPYPPFFGGDAIYSARLIESLAAAGASVTVLCHAFDESGAKPQARDRIDWRIQPPPRRVLARTVLSALPSIAARFTSADFVSALIGLLDRGDGIGAWDAVVLDHIGMGGALGPVLRRTGGGAGSPVIVHVSHNHEATVRMQVARDFRGNPLKRLALWQEGLKVARLERQLVQRCDLLTANTEDDARLFRGDRGDVDIVILRPGYDGPVVAERTIGAETPRRATIVGSFGWIAKRMNLEAFLAVAAPRFAAAGAELEILGNMPDGYRDDVQARFPEVLVRGSYSEIEPYLAKTRVGIVPEQTGGGFKHKVLSYVFCRVPVAALDGSVAGMPLQPGRDILYFEDMESLADGCIAAIDDLDRLNALQRSAFGAIEGAFDWAERGRALREAIEARADALRKRRSTR